MHIRPVPTRAPRVARRRRGGEPRALARRIARERAARLEAEAIAARVTRELSAQAKLLGLLQRIAIAANGAQTADEAFRAAVACVCTSTGWAVGHVYRPVLDGSGTLVSSELWWLDDPVLREPFRRATEGTVLPPGRGLPGLAAQSRHPVWSPDVAADPESPRVEAATAAGLRAGAAFPVIVGTDVAAVVEFYAARVAEPNDELLDAMVQIGSQLARVVERERAARAVRESERAYRLLAENVTDVIFVYDMQFRPTYISPSAERLRGYTVAEMMEHTLAERLAPSSVETALDLYREVTADPAVMASTPAHESRTVELEVRCKDGTTKWTETQMSFIRDEAGAAIGILGIARDITERRAAQQAQAHLEEQLRQAQKMEAIGRLAGGIAHDFNNVLTIITARTSLLLDQARSDREHRDLQTVFEAARRAASLTRQLLAFSRKQVLQPRALDLRGVVTGIEPMLRRLIGEDIDLGILAAAEPCGVFADPGQLEQVIMNLVVNARDAMPAGGRLTIETARLDLDASHAEGHVGVHPGPHVMLAVTDTGVGMDAATRARIFEPFFTTKPEGQGTGLGLATVFGIVAQSGGSIWVYSELDTGTTFKIYLPSVELQEPSRGSSPVAVRERPRGAETLLLVEDEEGVRLVAEELLTRLGYTVLSARNGEEALRVSARHAGPIALLVSDIVMPGMMGPEVHARLAGVRPEMRVLFLSGYAPGTIVHHGVLPAGTAFLEKPFGPDGLARKIRDVLDGRG
ncbi:MAG TPA: ATP-binding protein [Terriglobales bacterium]|nr:ATP-binding protein [Terriglobales bacterium]